MNPSGRTRERAIHLSGRTRERIHLSGRTRERAMNPSGRTRERGTHTATIAADRKEPPGAR